MNKSTYIQGYNKQNKLEKDFSRKQTIKWAKWTNNEHATKNVHSFYIQVHIERMCDCRAHS